MEPEMEPHQSLPGQSEDGSLVHPANPPANFSYNQLYNYWISSLLDQEHDMFEVIFSERTCYRSVYIGDGLAWSLFRDKVKQHAECLRPIFPQARLLHNYVDDKLQFWIDQTPRGSDQLLHFKKLRLDHKTLVDTFMIAINKRLDALPSISPCNKASLKKLRQSIQEGGSSSWPEFRNNKPDATLSFGLCPGLIIEVGDAQNWDQNEGVKNKAIDYVEQNQGTVAVVLYLGHRGRSIAMIGSKSAFPSSPQAQYLNGIHSFYAVEVMPLTSVADPELSQCLVPFRFPYLGGCIQYMLSSLALEEREMGFYFTFNEILQMMEMVDERVALIVQLVKDVAERDVSEENNAEENPSEEDTANDEDATEDGASRDNTSEDTSEDTLDEDVAMAATSEYTSSEDSSSEDASSEDASSEDASSEDGAEGGEGDAVAEDIAMDDTTEEDTTMEDTTMDDDSDDDDRLFDWLERAIEEDYNGKIGMLLEEAAELVTIPETQQPWNSVSAIQASLFTKPPVLTALNASLFTTSPEVISFGDASLSEDTQRLFTFYFSGRVDGETLSESSQSSYNPVRDPPTEEEEKETAPADLS